MVPGPAYFRAKSVLARLLGVWLGVGMAAVALGEPALRRFEFTQMEMAVKVKILLYYADEDAATAAA